MTRRTTVLLLLLIVIVAVAGLFIALSGKVNGDACKGVAGKHYTVIIHDSRVSSTHITGRLCDTMTIKNEDAVTREIGFGPHDDHVPYNGVAQRFLGQGESFTVTFDQTGSFRWHDHLHDEVISTFSVSK